jgi:hypothetical protein
MQTVGEQNMITPGYSASFSKVQVPANQTNRLKIREFISWAVCFGIITVLTGLLKYLKVGVTMDSVTSALFYLSLFGAAFFIYRIIMLSTSKSRIQLEGNNLHELN